MPRPRLRTQLSLELEPQLLERLRARAAAEGRPLSALVRRWLEAGLSGALEQPAVPVGPDVAELAERVGRIEAELAELRRPASSPPPAPPPIGGEELPPSGDAAASPLAPLPAGALTTAELAELLGIRRPTLNEKIRRAGGARVGLKLQLAGELWCCQGQAAGGNGGPPRWLWDRV